MDSLTLDERFYLLLHKKLLNKKGSAFRRAKKYYKDQYQKTGIIPGPLLLAEKGIMEGRRCSGRPRSLDTEALRRFITMVKASCDPSDKEFIFITRKARTIKNYHRWLEAELKRPISIGALRRAVKREKLTVYLNRPDFEDDDPRIHCFDPVPVFDLIQMDGCRLRYLKIRTDQGSFEKPDLIELYDTGSRYLFELDAFFAESSANAIDLFSQFLSGTPLPQKTIRIRPDNAKGFLNLKRVFKAVNLAHSVPNGFLLKPDFSRIQAPRDKAHLESSHRSLHRFEIRIIKAFDNRIIKTSPSYLFKGGKKEKITVTFLDVTLEELRASALLEEYRHEHNTTSHYFSENGSVTSWVPDVKFAGFIQEQKNLLRLTPEQANQYVKYGLKKVSATVSSRKTIRYKNRIYSVIEGAEAFNSRKGTRVKISRCGDRLFIFEPTDDGIFIGEAYLLEPPKRPGTPPEATIEKNELEKIIELLEGHAMTVDRQMLLDCYRKGLSLDRATDIVEQNSSRYRAYHEKIRQSDRVKGVAVFNAFVLDCLAHNRNTHVAPYALHGEV